MKNKQNYPENWTDEIRPKILKRDNFKCQKCQIKHRSIGYYNDKKQFIEADNFIKTWANIHNYKIIKIHLQVAHLDQNTLNNEDNNLLTMCPKCHLNYDRANNIVRRKQQKSNKKVIK
jgi:predicted patatin/cPLA2 family phospholipase